MERLSFAPTASYNATEAAIHLARYIVAAPFCAGKRILDVSCGEGYGASVLMRLGAASVEGIDISEDAIKTAKALFAGQGINFQTHDAESVDSLFPEHSFDLIVSFETIEHLRHPVKFLSAIRKLARDDTVIIISCPNDHWYYPTEQQFNPFHVKKYTFKHFQDLTVGALGPATTWAYGGPVFGFGSIVESIVAARDPMADQKAMLEFHNQTFAITLPPHGSARVGSDGCSYFVGIWGGGDAQAVTSAVVPLSMDQYSAVSAWQHAGRTPQQLFDLESEHASLLTDFRNSQLDLKETARQKERFRIQAFALTKELGVVMSQVQRLTLEGAEASRATSERDRLLTEIEALRIELRSFEGLRKLTKATAHAYVRRGIGITRGSILAAARSVRPYLPTPVLRLALRIARAMGI